MQPMDEQIFRKKLESLKHLPESYQPNIAAKWELLEATLPGNKKKSPFPWPGYATAAILLLFIGIKLFINTSNEVPARLPIAMGKKASQADKTVPFSNTDERKIAWPAKKVTKIRKAEEPELLISRTTKIQLDSQSTRKESPSIVMNIVPQSVETVPSAKKQRKVFRKDFEGFSIKDSNQTQTAEKSFRIKLLHNQQSDDVSTPLFRQRL